MKLHLVIFHTCVPSNEQAGMFSKSSTVVENSENLNRPNRKLDFQPRQGAYGLVIVYIYSAVSMFCTVVAYSGVTTSYLSMNKWRSEAIKNVKVTVTYLVQSSERIWNFVVTFFGLEMHPNKAKENKVGFFTFNKQLSIWVNFPVTNRCLTLGLCVLICLNTSYFFLLFCNRSSNMT